MQKNMLKTPSSISDTFFSKLKEQSFTIILLVAILWYQNNTYKQNLEEYKIMIDQKEQLILKMTDDERNRLLERTQYQSEQCDKYVDELINRKK